MSDDNKLLDGSPVSITVTSALNVLVFSDEWLATQPAERRIAWARQFLAGTGWVPARDIEAEVEAELRGTLSLRDVQALQVGRKIGHNACRAAMLGEEP